MRTIITTTGTSLLTNAVRELKKPSAQEVSDRELRHFFEQVGAITASAETNSLFKIATPNDEVVLLYTKTEEGQRCAEIVQQYLQGQKWSNIRLRQLPLEQNEARFERFGLRELVNILVDEIGQAQNRGREVIINATGGFKAEIAYTTMVGMVFQVPVKYIYQNFNQAITFPALPVTWNVDLLLEYKSFFEWIATDYRTQAEVEQRLKAIPDREQVLALLLPPDSDGHIFLSAAGEILWQRVAHQQTTSLVPDPPVSTHSLDDKISKSLQDVSHGYPKDTLKFAEKLAKVEFVDSIIAGFFENTTFGRIKRVTDEGVVQLLWADKVKAVNLNIQTTARGQAQTLKVCEQFIRPILESM